ncbi:MAG: phosphate acyltransferase PlsX, partial [Gemmatimonadota bacterium]
MVRVALDVMGGDRAPDAPVRGAASAVRDDEDLRVHLIGDPAELERALSAVEPEPDRDRLPVVAASESIGPGEPSAMAVRRKPDSSIVVGLRMAASGEADAFVSAGPTGAVMAGSLLELEALPGVDRPAIGAVFPTVDTPTLVLDVGANVNCRPRHLHQFAHLGLIYAREMLGRDVPRIGLLNVGEEAKKGDEVVAAAHDLLAADDALEFVGNVEGNQIIRGSCDVLVCDGFAGNALLKFFESMAEF